MCMIIAPMNMSNKVTSLKYHLNGLSVFSEDVHTNYSFVEVRVCRLDYFIVNVFLKKINQKFFLIEQFNITEGEYTPIYIIKYKTYIIYNLLYTYMYIFIIHLYAYIIQINDLGCYLKLYLVF